MDTTSRTVGLVTFNRTGGFSISASGGASLTINTGINVTATSSYTISAPIALGGNNVWDVTSGGTFTASGVISGTSTLQKSGSGLLVNSGANTYSGATTISAGTLSISTFGNATSASGVGINSSNDRLKLLLNGGTLRYAGSATTTDRHFSIGTFGGTIDASGASNAALKFDDWYVVGFPSAGGGQDVERTLTLTGTSTGENTLGIRLTDYDNGVPGGGSHSGSFPDEFSDFDAPSALTKTGTGRWILPANVTPEHGTDRFNNWYSGPTRILDGVLEVHGDNIATGSGTFGVSCRWPCAAPALPPSLGAPGR